MKQDKKFDQWIERSIAQFMKLTDEIDFTNSAESIRTEEFQKKKEK